MYALKLIIYRQLGMRDGLCLAREIYILEINSVGCLQPNCCLLAVLATCSDCHNDFDAAQAFGRGTSCTAQGMGVGGGG